MFAAPDRPRAPYEALHTVLATLSRDDFEERCAARDRAFRDQGITFSLSGEERPFPLDLVPRIIDESEWVGIEAGVRQRVLALEQFLADVYGAGEILADGVVPRQLVASSAHFHRCVAGIEPPGGVRIHVAGIDLVRDDAGSVPGPRGQPAHPVGDLVRRREPASDDPCVSRAVRQPSHPSGLRLPAAPARIPPEHGTCGRRRTCVVVLTPGLHNAAYFEHSFLARQMGVELVEGRDLVCREQCVFMRTTAGEQRVDVVYRRIDDDYLDPLQFRPDSVLGCAGIVNAARAGNVTIANAPGNGVADDKAVYPFVPAMIEYYLGEVPILANVETYRLEDPDVFEWVVERVDQLVCKPADGSGGYGLVIGPQASEQTLVDLRAKLVANPRGMDRAATGRAVDRADVRRRPDGPAPSRPPAVRGERRTRHLGRAGWSHAGGAPRRQPGRELQSGRRVEGHLGALGRAPTRGGRAGTGWGRARRSRPPLHPRSVPCPCTTGSNSSSSSDRRARAAPVLSRIAESLYWIGRYVERAEDTARLLDVHYHLLLEDRRADEAAVCRTLLEAMGVSTSEIGHEPDADMVTELLARDLSFSGSIACSVGASWENARGAREAISSELFQTLNTMRREVGRRARAETGPRA